MTTVPIRIVNPDDIMPGSESTWARMFHKRRNDKRNIATGGVVPEEGLEEQPAVVNKARGAKGCKKGRK
jgi:hypothetical protein